MKISEFKDRARGGELNSPLVSRRKVRWKGLHIGVDPASGPSEKVAFAIDDPLDRLFDPDLPLTGGPKKGRILSPETPTMNVKKLPRPEVDASKLDRARSKIDDWESMEDDLPYVAIDKGGRAMTCSTCEGSLGDLDVFCPRCMVRVTPVRCGCDSTWDGPRADCERCGGTGVCKSK